MEAEEEEYEKEKTRGRKARQTYRNKFPVPAGGTLLERSEGQAKERGKKRGETARKRGEDRH